MTSTRVGQTVLYRLTTEDAQSINAAATGCRPIGQFGNKAHLGDVLPAIIVKDWGGGPNDSVNLQVLLDGNFTHWVTSRGRGEGDGQWLLAGEEATGENYATGIRDEEVPRFVTEVKARFAHGTSQHRVMASVVVVLVQGPAGQAVEVQADSNLDVDDQRRLLGTAQELLYPTSMSRVHVSR